MGFAYLWRPVRTPVPSLLTAALLALSTTVQGQEGGLRLGPCLLSEDFEGGAIPAGWDIGPQVEQQDDDTGAGLGTFTDAWTVDTSPHVLGNAGYFRVPDLPAGNRFARANDDDDPCNCDLQDVGLTTPAIDLSGVSGAQLTFRAVVHQVFGGGPGRVQVSNDGGGTFADVATIPDTGPAWAFQVVDLSGFDGEPDVRVRFAWSDGTTWAVGFGVDDVCVSAALDQDLRLLEAFPADVTLPGPDVTVRSRPLTAVPLEQAGELVLAAVVANVGGNSASNVRLEAEVFLDGMPQGSFQGIGTTLAAGSVDTLVLATGWTPPVTGLVTAQLEVTSVQVEDDPTDNIGSTSLTVTGPAWGEGDHAFAVDAGSVERGIDNGNSGFIVANRVEVAAGTVTFHGASVAFADGTVPGALVRVEMRDDQLSPLALSDQTGVPAVAVNGPGGGSFTYIPFTTPLEVTGPADVYVCLSYANTANEVVVGASGRALPGASLLFDNGQLLWTSSLVSPMVRAHLDNTVGVPLGPAEASPLPIRPNPATDLALVELSEGGGTVQVLDAQGRVVREHAVLTGGMGTRAFRLDLGDLAEGLYQVVHRAPSGTYRASLVVAR